MFLGTSLDHTIERTRGGGILTFRRPASAGGNITCIDPNPTTKVETIIIINRPIGNGVRIHQSGTEFGRKLLLRTYL